MAQSSSNLFIVADAWRRTYPDAVAGVLVLRGVTNPGQHEELERRKTALEQALRRRFAGWDRVRLRTLPALAAYEAYYRPFGKTYHVRLQVESVALKGRAIPRVAALVEAMFMAELEDLLLTAGHDVDALRLPIRLDVASGDERYLLLNGQEQQLRQGDMFMADGEGVISSVLFGPDARTRITPETTSALFAVYAPPGIGPEAVRGHLDRIAATVAAIAPASTVERLELHEARLSTMG